MRITASQIVDWVNTKSKEAQANLPRLIRRLSFDATSTRQLSFPAGDSTFLPGWDGLLERERGNAWAPEGRSFWEMGCDQSPFKKANSDYQKRLAEVSREDRSEATFVFVTPRRWTKKTEWISEKKAKKEWADVRAYDADDLEQWLEQTPVVALQFAEELGLMGSGVESLNRYWQSWSQQSSPTITLESFFDDRAATRDQLIERVRIRSTSQDTAPLIIRADSIDEAVAFAVAALLSASDLADQSLVVTTKEGWQFVDTNEQLRIVIAARTDAALRSRQRVGLVTIIPHVIGDATVEASTTELLLDRPNVYEFEKALVAMGMEASDARRFALSTGRSWTVFRRQRAINPAIRTPAWLDSSQAESLGLLCLLGAWKADKLADQQLVAKLADRSYADVEKDLQYLALLDDPPLFHIGSVWKAKSPLELLNLFGDRITRTQLDRFFLIANEMLALADPQLELPTEQRYAAAIYGKKRPYSSLLLNSICDALVKLAVRGAEMPGLRALDISGRVARLVHDLLNDADLNRWLSISSHLPALAEASPDEFLAAVDRSLRLSNQPIAGLLTESSTAMFGGQCWHSGLLWALETLAWAPHRLARVALILAKLSHIPLNGNWGNTPSQSLFSLFRAWLPKTAAGVGDRIKVLDLVIKNDPKAAFHVLDGLTAFGSQTAMDSARPKWRDDDAGAGKSVTYAEMHEMQDAAKARMLELSAGHPVRIASLFQNTRRADGDGVDKVLALMQPFTLPAASDEDREILRETLRKVIYWHRNYDDRANAELESWLLPIEQCYVELTPINLIKRYCWLFNSHWVDLPIKDSKPTSSTKQTALQEYRVQAISEILKNSGIHGIEELIQASTEPGIVGGLLAEMDLSDFEWTHWFVNKGGDFIQGAKMTWCLRGFLHSMPAPRAIDFIQKIMKLAHQESWNAEKTARVLLSARAEKETWELASSQSGEVETIYWHTVQPAHYIRNEGEDLLFVFNRLLDIKRPKTALQCIQYVPERVEARALFSALQQFMLGEEPDGPQLESWHLGKMLEVLEQSSEVDRMALIQLEFSLFPALGYGQESIAASLYEGLMTEPTLFCDLICILCKPEHGERTEPVTEAAQAAASNAWKILHACKHQPGMKRDGSIDPQDFAFFIERARDLCRKADRLARCDQTLGQILAFAPKGIDDSWPFAPACEVLDHPDFDDIRDGFYIGVRNKRGMTTRSPLDGGGQERNLAAVYRGFAQNVQYSYPKLAVTLEKIAKSYEIDGQREDADANLRKEGY